MEILTNNNDDFGEIQDDQPIFNRRKSLANAKIPQIQDQLVITKLTPGIKNPNRVNIFINNKYSFSLDVAQVVDFNIKPKQVITEKQLKDYKHASEYGKLYQSTLEWSFTRPHSIKETIDHLNNKKYKRDLEQKRYDDHLYRLEHDPEYQARVKDWRQKSKEFKGSKKVSFEENNENEYGAKNIKSPFPSKPAPSFSEEDIKLVVQTLIDKGYLDDQRFAEYYVENRFVKKGISTKRLRQELSQKGIDSTIIEQVLQESRRSDSEEITKIIAKKRSRYNDQKLIAYLIRQGFSFDESKNAVENYKSDDI